MCLVLKSKFRCRIFSEIRHFALLLALVAAYTCNTLAHADDTCRPRTGKLRIFDATLFTGKPEASELGLQPIKVLYGEMWKSPADYPNVPNADTISSLVKSVPSHDVPVVLDIEQWPIKGDPSTVQASVIKFKETLRRFHSAAPHLEFGLYSMLPVPDYWRATSKLVPVKEAWQEETERLRDLEASVDFLSPSLYTYYEDTVGWTAFARAQICEARRISSKPVLVFLWPEYHDSNRKLRGQYIGSEFWKLQLTTVAELADGIIIWGGYDTQKKIRRSWDPDAEWWRTTQAFLAKYR